MGDMLTEKSKKSEAKRDGVGEPPPLIKYIIWLWNPQNWKMHWKAILLALVVILAVFFIPKIMEFRPEKPLPDPDKLQEGLLTEEQIRSAIRKALQVGDVDIAKGFLSGLGDSSVKFEECEHVYDFCIKNGRLNEAKSVVDECWEGSQKKEKLALIEHEQLKQ